MGVLLLADQRPHSLPSRCLLCKTDRLRKGLCARGVGAYIWLLLKYLGDTQDGSEVTSEL